MQTTNNEINAKTMLWIKLSFWTVSIIVFIFSVLSPVYNTYIIRERGQKIDAIIAKKEFSNLTGDLGSSWYYKASTNQHDSLVSIHNDLIDFRNYSVGQKVSIIIIKDSPDRFLFVDIYDKLHFPLLGFAFTVIFSGGIYLMWMIGAVWFPNLGHDDEDDNN